MLAKWEREGRIHGGSLAGRRGGLMIIDAASTDELADLLMTLPFWGLQDWKITPLSSNEGAAKRVREMSQQLRAPDSDNAQPRSEVSPMGWAFDSTSTRWSAPHRGFKCVRSLTPALVAGGSCGPHSQRIHESLEDEERRVWEVIGISPGAPPAHA